MRIKVMSIIVVLAFCYTLVAVVAPPFASPTRAAGTWYVNPGESIQAAIDAASHGDTIIVRDGTYTVNTIVVDKQVSIKSENGFAFTMVHTEWDTSCVFRIAADYVNIEGLNIRGIADTHGLNPAVIFATDTKYCTLKNNIIFGETGIKIDGSYNKILNNDIYGNDHRGVTITDSATGNIICQNTVHSHGDEDCIIAVFNSFGNFIYLNTFFESTPYDEVLAFTASNTWHSPAELSYTYDGTVYENYLGNYWQEYSGLDSNNDGIGETSYIINGDNDGLYPLIDTSDNYTLNIENHAPYLPAGPSPADGVPGVSIDIELNWSGGDPDIGDTLTYDIYFGTAANPETLVSDNHTGIRYIPGTLAFNTHYYWKVVALDNHKTITEGPVWDFITAINNQPDKPTNSSPSDGAIGTSLTPALQSLAFSDPDDEDSHAASQWQISIASGDYSSPVYDSGTDAQNLTKIDILSGTLSCSTTYYWHIRYQDSNGTWSDWSEETYFITDEEESGEVGGCSCGANESGISGTELIIGWGILGICWGGGYYMARRFRRRKI